MPLKSISSPYYLPISSSHQLFLTPFPSKLWQKVGPKGIDVDGQSYIESWHKQSPSLRHEILTDDSAEQYVREQFAALPDIRDTYLALQVPILKADLLRQLRLYMEGGIWSDMDVTCLAPIDSWVPMVHQGRTNLVVGLEFDGSQFASWTIMAKPRSVHIAMAIGYIMDALASSAAQHNTNIAGLTMKTITDVVDVTGPQAMTRAILDSLSIQMEAPVGRSNISNLLEPTLLHDVLVLPNAAFAAMQGGWPKNHGPYLVEHHYAGSWKNEKGGEVVER
jgi:mannosyltransferase OCH1-like enzyme